MRLRLRLCRRARRRGPNPARYRKVGAGFIPARVSDMNTLLIALVISASLLAGCEQRTMTEADCAAVKQRLEKAWHRDAIAASRLANKTQFRQFIRDEGTRIGESWMERCKPMVGRAVDATELDCLNKAQTVDDVYECAPVR
jgi:hypothetical protein